jgi:hypothetical protein
MKQINNIHGLYQANSKEAALIAAQEFVNGNKELEIFEGQSSTYGKNYHVLPVIRPRYSPGALITIFY